MINLPRRSELTSLSNDELILLDVMFDKSVTFQQLRGRDFGLRWNYQSHSLDDEQLRETLLRFMALGWIDNSEDKPFKVGDGSDHRFSLTPVGGHYWELERRPRWNRYATQYFSNHERPFITDTRHHR